MIADSQTVFDLAVVRSWTWVIAGAISVAALYITRRHDNRYVPSRRGMACVAALLLVAWTWPQGLGRVQPGARGVVLRFGAPTGRTVDEGLYYVLPVAERVVQVNTQLNTLAVDRAQGTCSDLEPVYADVAVTFHIDPARAVDVYRSLRFDYAERLLRPAISDAWKETTARYLATDVIERRPELQRLFRTAISERVEKFGFEIDAVAMTRMNFAFGYAQAAQQKVAAVQRTLQAQQDLQRIRFEAQQSMIRAKSEVEALTLQRKVPAAQLMRMRELDLERRAIEKWDGHLPQAMGQTPFFGSALEPHHD